MGFATQQIDRVRPLWDRMLSHPFLLETRDGAIADETFARWMRQDFVFVEAAIPFIAAMIPRAPKQHWQPHADVVVAFTKELDLFRERAEAAGVDLTDVEPSFTCHAYVEFLLATAYRRSYEEAYTLLYAAEKCYHDSWKVVKEGIDPDSMWYPFVENWAGDAFAQYVAYLEGELDRLADEAGDTLRGKMAEIFETTVRYEIAFWEMAFTDDSWPGIPEG